MHTLSERRFWKWCACTLLTPYKAPHTHILVTFNGIFSECLVTHLTYEQRAQNWNEQHTNAPTNLQ